MLFYKLLGGVDSSMGQFTLDYQRKRRMVLSGRQLRMER